MNQKFRQILGTEMKKSVIEIRLFGTREHHEIHRQALESKRAGHFD
jgi:hypothetical protein